ncbi:hypothetical protein CA54_11580 [Symmachiella macrocystis]|uniref:Uncharacterized protein n=2 Tax=Symmachiella macrocystis TaxID=2527985 RepID=A0A5C6BK11_9PLAN|nr:hypothetical protein CA54_11580 [Symmachiella macrocystis]
MQQSQSAMAREFMNFSHVLQDGNQAAVLGGWSTCLRPTKRFFILRQGKFLFLNMAICIIFPHMKHWKRYLGILLVVYVLSIGPVFGLALNRQAYPAALDEPTGQALTIVYFPVDAVADAVPLIGISLRRYQMLWFRIFSR